MNPEGKINQERWYVLQKIQEEFLRTKTEEPINYWVYFSSVGENRPTLGDEAKTLEKLEELGVIEIQNPGGTLEYE